MNFLIGLAAIIGVILVILMGYGALSLVFSYLGFLNNLAVESPIAFGFIVWLVFFKKKTA